MTSLDQLFDSQPSSAVNDALAFVDEKDVAGLTMDMINVHSPVGGELELARYLEGHFQRLGLKTWMQEVEPNRFNVFGRLEGTGGGPTLLYAGHLDSAYAGDEEGIADLGSGYQPTAQRDGDWIYGLGAFNMKGGHAASILAVEALARAKTRLRGDVIIGGVVGETCHAQTGRYQGARYRGCGIGARFMVANGMSADMAVIPEPTSNRISIATGGYVFFELATKAYPKSTFRRGGIQYSRGGPDAIEKMFKAIPSIRGWGDDYLANTRYRGEEAGNVDIIAIEGGHPFRPTKRSCACRLYLEVGMMPGQSQADIVASLRDCTDRIRDEDPEIDIAVNIVQTTLPSEVSSDEAIVRSLAASHAAEWGTLPDVAWDGWYADTAPLNRAGIPSVCYGPQGRARDGSSGNYPSNGEQVSISDLTRGAQVFVRTAVDACSKERNEFKQAQPR